MIADPLLRPKNFSKVFLVRKFKIARISALVLTLSAASSFCHAYESDVHYGLTHWLAFKAGFSRSEAEAIALGNQRVDSGAMSSLEIVFDYACVNKDGSAAQKITDLHFPSAESLPRKADARNVKSGGQAARHRIESAVSKAKGHEGQMLGLFGGGLHTLQDSWAHAGTPGLIALGGGLSCDSSLAAGHPLDRGGADSHESDQTHAFPSDTIAMAKATYDALIAYPAIQSRRRTAEPWSQIADSVAQFAAARTKSEKRAWHVARGLEDTGFLEGVTLPDGLNPGPLRFLGRSLPPLVEIRSTQWNVPMDAKLFFDGLLNRWLGSESVESVVTELAGPPPKTGTLATETYRRRLRQLTGRMLVWKVKDHGTVAKLAHSKEPLTEVQLALISKLTRDKSVFLKPATPAEALFPLVAKGDEPSPLLPYVIRELPSLSSPAVRRISAFARVKHAPYDTIGWIAEESPMGWVLVDVLWAVDH